MTNTLNKEHDSSFLVDISVSIIYDKEKSITELNLSHEMNKQLVAQVVGQLKQEKANNEQLLDHIRKTNTITPTAAKMIEETEYKVKLIGSALEPFEKYLLIEGISLDGTPSDQINVPLVKSRRRDSLREVISAYPMNQEFDIDIIRTQAQQTFPKVFGKQKKDRLGFYPVYWGVINELREAKKIKVANPGKGKRSTVFVRIAEFTKKT